ncbi:hypothetical protein KEM60_00640 [Austwickia sp. TVS 96-490-7B]|uniref:YlxR family protein n=1 Tax=Austwickia sp. TVS 96-490-7B TaxID=2830843 RepID=UPI001C590640|nr:YlxR family protein [Austwickia sp. TVS 96-490-7B]MBW3084452.1 hypothetical protein [Austwickia sp. TVS 96-490-7B]
MNQTVPAGPVRTCVGCRGRESRSKLLRVVVAEREDGPILVVDHRRRLPGRGAWLHESAACLNEARRRQAFRRALRVTAPLDVSLLLDELAAQIGTVQETQDTSKTTEGLSQDLGRNQNRKRV